MPSESDLFTHPDQLVVITHGGCNDGHTAAWLLSLLAPDATFVGALHGEVPPDVAGKHVIMADFAYRRPVLLEMLEACASMLLLDHHRTAKQDLDGLEHPKLTLVFDMDRCGARLVKDHFAAELECTLGSERWERAQTFVAYIDDRDRWVRALPNTDEWTSGVLSHGMTFDTWSRLAFEAPDTLISDGAAIQRHRGYLIESAIARAAEVKMAGYAVFAANCDSTITSEVGAALSIDRPFAACYQDDGDSRRWSLRSDENGLDVSAIAEGFGGGGHARAAGFRTPRDTWPAEG